MDRDLARTRRQSRSRSRGDLEDLLERCPRACRRGYEDESVGEVGSAATAGRPGRERCIELRSERPDGAREAEKVNPGRREQILNLEKALHQIFDRSDATAESTEP